MHLLALSLLIAAPALATDALKLSGRVQTRYTLDATPGEFSLPRVRLKLSGANDYLKKISFEMDFSKGAMNLKDAAVDLSVFDVVLRLGQFKKPFSRQQLTSSSRQSFVERAATDKAFNTGRDLGLMIHNGHKNRFEYAFGIFNGYGEKGVFNSDKGKFSNLTGNARPLVVARFGGNYGAPMGYDEVDFSGGALRVAAAFSAQQFFANKIGERESRILGADLLMKMAGMSLAGELFYGGEAGAESQGVNLQLAYLLNKKVQPALRFTQVDDEASIMFGFSSFLNKHKLKWQTDISRSLSETAQGVGFRTQLQTSF